jgi:hypothetical protein
MRALVAQIHCLEKLLEDFCGLLEVVRV